MEAHRGLSYQPITEATTYWSLPAQAHSDNSVLQEGMANHEIESLWKLGHERLFSHISEEIELGEISVFPGKIFQAFPGNIPPWFKVGPKTL